MSEVATLFDRLIPPTDKIQDVAGKTYDVPTAISARRAILATREIRAILSTHCLTLPQGDEKVEMDVARTLMFAHTLSEGGNHAEAAKAMAAVLDVAGEGLAAAFSAAYPDLADGDPLDLFPMEAVIGALLPLFARLGGSVLGLAKVVHPES